MTKTIALLAFALSAAIVGVGEAQAQAAASSPAGETVIDPEIVIQAESTSSAAAGNYKRGDEELTSTTGQVKTQAEHVAAYDGPTEFRVDYTIVTRADGSPDLSKSTVQMTAINFTSHGKTVPTSFKTPPIPITKILFNADGSINTIEFKGEDWYDPNAAGANGIKGIDLTGSINLRTGKATYKSVYQIKSNGVLITYNVTGAVKMPPKPAPGPGAGPEPGPGKPFFGDGGAAPIIPVVILGLGGALLIGGLSNHEHPPLSP